VEDFGKCHVVLKCFRRSLEECLKSRVVCCEITRKGNGRKNNVRESDNKQEVAHASVWTNWWRPLSSSALVCWKEFETLVVMEADRCQINAVRKEKFRIFTESIGISGD
jgi:hypothetical protein